MPDLSYSYQNIKRDLSDAISLVSQAEPTLISLVTVGGEPARATKHEWLEDVLEPEGDTLSAAVDASATSLSVADGTKFVEGMVLAFEGYDEIMKVTAVSGNTLTVVRGYGGTTPEAMAAGTEIKIVSRPRPEATDPGDDRTREPGVEWNQTEIFDYTVKVSKTAQAIKIYGIDNLINYQVNNALKILSRRMNNALIYGRRVQRAANEPGSMGGILQFVGQAGGNVFDAAGASLTSELLNDAIEEIVRKGGRPNVLLANTVQARKISAFNVANLQIERSDTTAGNVVYRFVNDLPMGIITTIVVDINFPKGKLAILDTSRIRVCPLEGRGMSDEDATPPGADYIGRRVLGEYTAEIKNAKEAHGLITNLAV